MVGLRPSTAVRLLARPFDNKGPHTGPRVADARRLAKLGLSTSRTGPLPEAPLAVQLPPSGAF